LRVKEPWLEFNPASPPVTFALDENVNFNPNLKS
jgi:hypothetical protein